MPFLFGQLRIGDVVILLGIRHRRIIALLGRRIRLLVWHVGLLIRRVSLLVWHVGLLVWHVGLLVWHVGLLIRGIRLLIWCIGLLIYRIVCENKFRAAALRTKFRLRLNLIAAP